MSIAVDRTSNRRLRLATHAIAVAVCCGVLAACSTYDAVQKKLGLATDDTILPGKREAVLTTGVETSPDPELSATPIVIPTAYTNPDWAQPGGTPNNALQHVALGPQLTRAWSADAGRGSSSQGRLTSSPIVANGRVFVLDTLATLRAFEASSGKQLWSKSLAPDNEEDDEGFGGGVASDGRMVYATTAFGNIMAMEAASGQLVWGKRIDGPFRAAPTVANGQVYVTSMNNEVFCLSAEDGTVLWKFEGVAESASLLSSTSPAVHNGIAVIPYTSGEIIAFDVNDGRPLWGDSLVRTGNLSSLASLNDISGRPAMEGNQVIAISHSGRMIAVNAQNGERQWSKNVSGTQTPWIAGPYVFVITDDRTMLAMTRDEGRVRWSAVLPSEQVWSGPVLAGGRLIAVSSEGLMINVNVQTGEIISQVDLGPEMFISPVVAGNVVYLLTDDADLIAMR